MHDPAFADLECSGRVTVLDSRVILKALLVERRPDLSLFVSVIGAIIDEARAAAPSGRVRAFGDLVVLLANAGDIAASIAVERFWNEILSTHSLSLFCAYPIRLFGQASLAETFCHICDEHSDVVPIGLHVDSPESHSRFVAVLQQQAHALQVEIAERRRTEARLESLGRLSQVLSTSLDYERTLENVLALTLPSLGDFGFLDMVEGPGTVRRLARAHEDPETESWLSEARGFGSPERWSLSALASGKPALHSAIDDLWMQLAAASQDELALMRRLSLCSMITVPLERKGRILGSLTLFYGPSGRRHDGVDLELAREMAHRAAIAVENARLYRERAEALRRQEEANRRKDEFLAMLGHELRNPLAPIRMAVELMDKRGDTCCQRERRVIRHQVEHLTRLVDDLLDVSRITHGKIELRKTPVEIAAVVVRAIEVVSPLLEQRAHTLSVSVPLEGLVVQGDPVRLSQIFANLLNNAAIYANSGSQIAISARHDRGNGEMVVEVSDTGWGIRKEVLSTIFEPFVQGERSLDRALGGLGLGLSLVKGLAVLHGGTVSVHSEGPGKGSTFTVRLPVVTDANGGASDCLARAAFAPDPDRRSVRVLAVDDNRDAVDTLAEALREEGYEVTVAYDGAEALLRAAESSPDIALIDIGLPVMDGFEVATRLREGCAGSKPKLIALTGYGRDCDRARSREVGFDLHLTKPVSLDTVLGALKP